MTFEKGDRVRIDNPNNTWGIGQVLEITSDNYIKIFFVKAGEKRLRLDKSPLIRLEGDEAFHPLLANLGTRGGKKLKVYKSFDELVKIFLAIFPEGFYDQEYRDRERNYKIAAHELLVELLDKVIYQSLIDQNDYDEIVSRAMKVVNKTNLIFPNEKMALKDGLKETQSRDQFVLTLYNLLYGENELDLRFRQFANCLNDMKAAKWTNQTYFLFLRYPDTHIFLKPTVIQNAANTCAFDIKYDSQLNWQTYEALLEFGQYVKDQLKSREPKLQPRDMVDVQSFMWCVAPGSYSDEDIKK